MCICVLPALIWVLLSSLWELLSSLSGGFRSGGFSQTFDMFAVLCMNGSAAVCSSKFHSLLESCVQSLWDGCMCALQQSALQVITSHQLHCRLLFCCTQHALYCRFVCSSPCTASMGRLLVLVKHCVGAVRRRYVPGPTAPCLTTRRRRFAPLHRNISGACHACVLGIRFFVQGSHGSPVLIAHA
jgi:hypothetical protein